MNLPKIAKKLQTALCMKGRYIRVNQYQFYSSRVNKMVTKYVVSERQMVWLETHSCVEVVRCLAAIYEGGS